jgi:hypothetical protein
VKNGHFLRLVLLLCIIIFLFIASDTSSRGEEIVLNERKEKGREFRAKERARD